MVWLFFSRDVWQPWHHDFSPLISVECGYVVEVSMDRIRIGYPAGYFLFVWIRIGFGYLFLKKIGSGQDQDICLISITKFS